MLPDFTGESAQCWRRNWKQVIPFFALAHELLKISTPPMPSRVLRSGPQVDASSWRFPQRRATSSCGWCCAMCRRGGKILRPLGKLPRPRWRSNSRTGLYLLTNQLATGSNTKFLTNPDDGQANATPLLPILRVYPTRSVSGKR